MLCLRHLQISFVIFYGHHVLILLLHVFCLFLFAQNLVLILIHLQNLFEVLFLPFWRLLHLFQRWWSYYVLQLVIVDFEWFQPLLRPQLFRKPFYPIFLFFSVVWTAEKVVLALLLTLIRIIIAVRNYAVIQVYIHAVSAKIILTFSITVFIWSWHQLRCHIPLIMCGFLLDLLSWFSYRRLRAFESSCVSWIVVFYLLSFFPVAQLCCWFAVGFSIPLYEGVWTLLSELGQLLLLLLLLFRSHITFEYHLWFLFKGIISQTS